MESAQLKTSENDKIMDLVRSYSDYRREYETFITIKDNVRNVLVLLFMLIPAMAKHFFPSWEAVVLLSFVCLLFFLWHPIKSLSNFLVRLGYSRISKTRMEKIDTYIRYGEKVKLVVKDTLAKGSFRFVEDVARRLND